MSSIVGRELPPDGAAACSEEPSPVDDAAAVLLAGELELAGIETEARSASVIVAAASLTTVDALVFIGTGLLGLVFKAAASALGAILGFDIAGVSGMVGWLAGPSASSIISSNGSWSGASLAGKCEDT